jgi:MHS family proline/betaine transporter-like MFS transporter
MTEANPASTPNVAGQPDERTVRRAVAASAIGNAVEWYDFGVFTAGIMTSIVGSVFFSEGDQYAVLRSFALVAIAFIVRPFGGAYFGTLGDKLGRQRVLAITILLMSGSTFLIGVLPSYESIGLAAPILLLLIRLLQGFSTGGEYGGAATFIAEYAPTKRRGFFGAFLEFGTLAGYVTGAGLVLLSSLALGPETMNSWGWRIPFLLALPLGLVGLYLRLKLEDTPVFQQLTEKESVRDKPRLKETITQHWRMILNLIAIVLLLNVADYTLLTTMPSYFTKFLGVGDNEAQVIVIVVEVLMMLVILPLGKLSDRVGRKPLLLTAAIGFIVLSFPAIKLMQSGNVVGLLIGFGLVAGLLVCMLAVIGSTFPAMFPTRVRYTSFAIGYNLSTSIFGGTAGLVIVSLITATGSNDIPAYYLVIAGAIALIPILKLPETAGMEMKDIETANTGGKISFSSTVPR